MHYRCITGPLRRRSGPVIIIDCSGRNCGAAIDYGAAMNRPAIDYGAAMDRPAIDYGLRYGIAIAPRN